MSEARCCKCGDTFEVDTWQYCGEDFCPSCRREPQDAVINAEKESYATYRSDGHSAEEAGKRAYNFAKDVERERRRRGR